MTACVLKPEALCPPSIDVLSRASQGMYQEEALWEVMDHEGPSPSEETAESCLAPSTT